MKFGFGAIPDTSIAEIVALAQLGEELGFHTAWVPDQTFYRDPFVVLSACALGTKRIHLGLGATNPYTRHPVQVARAASALNELSRGRFRLAYGAGNRKELLSPLGRTQDRAGQRCREAVKVTKQLLAGEEVHERSSTIVADGVKLLAPAQADLPVFLAGRGPAVLRAAGEFADGVIIGGLVSPQGLEFALASVHEGKSRRLRPPVEFGVVSWISCNLTEADRSAAVERVKPNVAHIIGGAPTPVLHAIGLSDERIGELKRAYERGGPAGAAPLVTETEVDMLALVGTPEHCVNRINRLADAGVNEVVVLLHQSTTAARGDFLRCFAAHVMGQVS